MRRYAALAFLSAFLLFLVQPLIAKAILPWFGGAPAVWTTAMLFFQLLLLGGYAYADLTSRLPPRRQALVHAALLLLSLAFLPIIPSAEWKPSGTEGPVWRILGLLTDLRNAGMLPNTGWGIGGRECEGVLRHALAATALRNAPLPA